MGVGKTYYGKHWAAKYKLSFIDLDAYIEKKEGQSITEIFANSGEDYFRTIEAQSLKEIELEEVIIATGGGTPCHKDNMKFMQQTGVVIWLEASPEYIAERLKSGIDKRPLLNEMKEDLLRHVKGLLVQREDCYSKAQYHLSVEQDIDKAIQKIFTHYA